MLQTEHHVTLTRPRSVILNIVLILLGATAPSLFADAAEQWPYLPPAWSERVVFYHAFEQGMDQPAINRAGLEIRGEKTPRATGLVGRGYRAANQYAKQTPLTIQGGGLSVHKPLTLMHWWRLDAPMEPETSFQLLRLGGSGHISSFVRGKGDWCALREPTYISQVWGFPGISNYNNPWGGPAWFKDGEWHHVAITVANAREVRIYWDGVLRETILAKGRPFREGDVRVAALDCNWLYHPMTIDEVILLDRALRPEEVAQYVLAVRQLRAVNFPGTDR